MNGSTAGLQPLTIKLLLVFLITDNLGYKISDFVKYAFTQSHQFCQTVLSTKIFSLIGLDSFLFLMIFSIN